MRDRCWQQCGPGDRWAAIHDALFQNGRVESATVRGVGLRGGRFVARFDPETAVVSIAMDGARFTRDVAVRGRARLRGAWFPPNARTIRISGRLGGRRLAAAVPAG